jgi:hypothetical protein
MVIFDKFFRKYAAGSQQRPDNLNSQNKEIVRSSTQPSFKDIKDKMVNNYSKSNFPTSTKNNLKIGGKLTNFSITSSLHE